MFRGEGELLRIKPDEVFDESRYEEYGVGVRTERHTTVTKARIQDSYWKIQRSYFKSDS